MGEVTLMLGGPGEANAQIDQNPRVRVRTAIHKMRRALWKVEHHLKLAESQSGNPAGMKEQFSAMFDALIVVLQEFYGFTWAAFGHKMMMDVIKDFHRRFDWLRR